MPIESRLQLKTYFETGDIPTEDQFINVLDSYFHLLDGNIGNIILTGSIDVSGSINATGTASFGFITSSLPSGSDDTVVILDGNNVFRQREIDSRVWGTTLLDGDNLTAFNVPQVLDDNTLTDSVIFASQNDSIGIGTGYLVAQSAKLTVQGGISASGMLHAGDITSSNHISASKNISGSSFWTNNANVTTTITSSIISASKHISASNMGAHSGHFHHITASVDDITNGNISASGYISASAGDFNEGNITNVGSIFLDTIETDNGNTVNANTGFFFISGNLVVDEAISASLHVTTNNITASGNVSASLTVSASKYWGLSASIERINAVNISASKFISASDIWANTASINRINTTNISASGYVSASNVGAHTGSMEIINLGHKLQHIGDTTTALTYTNGRAVLGSGLAQIDLSGSNDPLLIKQILINNNLANTDFLIFSSGSGNNIFRTVARSGSILIGGYTNAGDATLAHNNKVSIRGNVFLDGVNGNLTASQNISASGYLSASGIDVGEGNITNVGTVFADVLEADNSALLNIVADNTFVTGALTIERDVSGSSDFFGRDAYFRNITASANISASDTVTGLSGSFTFLTTQTLSANSGSFNYISSTGDISASGNMIADTASFGHVNVEGKISHTGDQNVNIDFTTERMILGSGRAQIDLSGSVDATKPQSIVFNNAFHKVNTIQYGLFGGGSGSSVPVFKVWAESHSIIVGQNSVPTAPGEFTNTLHDNKAKLGVAGGLHVHKPGTSGYISNQYIVAQGDVSSSGTGSFDYGFVNQDFLTRKIYIGQHFFGGGGIPSASQDNGTARLFISGSGPNNVLVRVMDAASRELLFVSGGVGIGTINPGKELEVIGDISASGDLEIKNITASANISASGDLIINDVSASGDISASGNIYMDQTAGTDNSVVVLDSTGKLVTDEVDPKVWAQKLVDYTGTPVNNQIAIFTDIDTIEGDAELTYDGTTLSVDGIVSASGNLTAASASLYSITNNSGTTFLIDGDGDDIDIKNASAVTIHSADFEIKAGNAVVNGNISASGHLTASNVGAPIATFTNVTASNYSASGYVSASNIGASSVNSAHITASGNTNITGYLSASNLGANVVRTGNVTASGHISASGTGSFGFLDIANVTVNNFSGGSITGSSVTGSFTGSLLGTASWAANANNSVTSSHALTAVSSSVAALSTTAHTASHAVTASHAITTITASHALITSNNPNNFKNTGRRVGNASISGNLHITGGQGLLGNISTYGDVTASGRLVLGNSTEIYSGSIDGPNVLILHTTGGLTNFFAGAYAGASNVVEGEQNIGIGYEAANNLSTGDENTWIGYQAGKDNTIGDRNVAIGRSALENNVNGDGNIAIGYKAGENETGDNKLYIGNDANPVLIKGDMAIDEVKIYGLLAATHSISSSGHLFSSNSLSNTSMHQVVVWDSGSGRYYHTGSYGGGGGGGAADNLGNHSASLALFMNSQSINEVNDVRFVSNSSIHDNYIGYSSSAHSNVVEFRDKIQKIIISGSIIRDTRTSYTNYIPPSYKLGIGLNGTPATPNANIHVKGNIWASGSNGNITASGHVSASGKVMATTASFGTKATNTTNTAGNVLYVHGNASGSDKLMFATAAFGTPATNTTNTAGNVLYVHGNTSGSGKVSYATASFGITPNDGTNPRLDGAQIVLFTRGHISSSANVLSHNYTASGQYHMPSTNTAGSGSMFANGSRVLHFMGSGTTFLGKNAGNFGAGVGAANVGIGEEALTSIQGGGNNIAVGYQAADSLTTGTNNIVLGRGAMSTATTETTDNIVIGYRGAILLESSKNNTLIGSNVAEVLTNSHENTAVGYLALSASIGEDTQKQIALGYKAGAHNTTSSKMFLGNAHVRGDANDWFSVIEGEMDLTSNTSGSGRATINQILRIFPTGSPGIIEENQVPASFRPGDIVCSGSGTVGSKHYLMFYDGTQWVKISNN